MRLTAHPDAGQLQPRRRRGRRARARRGPATTSTTLDLYAIGFAPPCRPGRARAPTTATQPLLDPMVAEHAALVRRAEALVFVYPTWWSEPPAILRGWLERVLVPGVAFRSTSRARSRPALHQRPADRRRSARTASPWTYVKLLQRRRPADAHRGPCA